MNDVVIFFDLFDTLVTADRGYLEPYFDSNIDKLGDIGVLKNSKMAIDEIVKKYPNILEKHSIEEMIEYYEECMKKSITNVNNNIYTMLYNLKQIGCKLCIISDAAYTDIKYWKNSALSTLFDETIFSCEVGYSKPNSKIYEIAKEKMSSPNKCIFVGDGGHNELYGAIISGMKTIKANWFVNRNEEAILNYSNYQISDVRIINEIVKNIIIMENEGRI